MLNVFEYAHRSILLLINYKFIKLQPFIHIYDYLLSAVSTPGGGQSFWWRQQSLPKNQQI